MNIHSERCPSQSQYRYWFYYLTLLSFCKYLFQSSLFCWIFYWKHTLSLPRRMKKTYRKLHSGFQSCKHFFLSVSKILIELTTWGNEPYSIKNITKRREDKRQNHSILLNLLMILQKWMSGHTDSLRWRQQKENLVFSVQI